MRRLSGGVERGVISVPDPGLLGETVAIKATLIAGDDMPSTCARSDGICPNTYHGGAALRRCASAASRLLSRVQDPGARPTLVPRPSTISTSPQAPLSILVGRQWWRRQGGKSVFPLDLP